MPLSNSKYPEASSAIRNSITRASVELLLAPANGVVAAASCAMKVHTVRLAIKPAIKSFFTEEQKARIKIRMIIKE